VVLEVQAEEPMPKASEPVNGSAPEVADDNDPMKAMQDSMDKDSKKTK
jgi:hypothetical protein